MAKVLEHGSANIVPDTDAFRLCCFTERLVQVDAVEIRDERTDLIDIADALDGNAKSAYDLTLPFGDKPLDNMVPATPMLDGERFENVLMAPEDVPKTFCQLTPALEETRRTASNALQTRSIDSPARRHQKDSVHESHGAQIR